MKTHHLMAVIFVDHPKNTREKAEVHPGRFITAGSTKTKSRVI